MILYVQLSILPNRITKLRYHIQWAFSAVTIPLMGVVNQQFVKNRLQGLYRAWQVFPKRHPENLSNTVQLKRLIKPLYVTRNPLSGGVWCCLTPDAAKWMIRHTIKFWSIAGQNNNDRRPMFLIKRKNIIIRQYGGEFRFFQYTENQMHTKHRGRRPHEDILCRFTWDCQPESACWITPLTVRIRRAIPWNRACIFRSLQLTRQSVRSRHQKNFLPNAAKGHKCLPACYGRGAFDWRKNWRNPFVIWGNTIAWPSPGRMSHAGRKKFGLSLRRSDTWPAFWDGR